MTNATGTGTDANPYAVSPAGLAEILGALIPAQLPIMVWGGPGVGKSHVSRDVAAALSTPERTWQYRDIRALLYDPVDFRGIPYRDADGMTAWAPPKFLPPTDSADGFLVNFEELTAAAPSVQAALYQLILDRACGEYRLPEHASTMACGNRISDRGVAFRMPTPLANRFVHIEVEPDCDQWLQWATGAGIDTRVVFYLSIFRGQLTTFNPQSKEAAFASPRTWEYTSRLLDRRGTIPETSWQACLAGTIGQGPAVEFGAFLRVWDQLQHPRAILDSPDTAAIPSDASALVATCGALVDHVDQTTFGAMIRYAKRLRPELGEFAVGQALARKPELQRTRTAVQWYAHQSA